MRWGLLATLVFAAGQALAQGTNVNPAPGSVWTYLGPSWGANWSAGPMVSSGGSGVATRIAVWNGTSSIYAPMVSSVVTGSLGPEMSIGDGGGSPGYTPGGGIPTSLYVMSHGARNALIGEVTNEVPYSTSAFLAVGTTGYGKVPAGNSAVVFGLYGLGELWNQYGEALGGEVTARNFSGANAANGVPPPTGSPTTNAIANGWHITCGTTPPSASPTWDCSTGLYITNESGGSLAKASWANAAIIEDYRIYGLYIRSGDTGSVSAELDNPGSGLNLVLKTTSAMVPSNAVMEVADSSGAGHAYVYQNGDFHGNNLVFTGGTYFLQNIGTGSGGKCVGINASGSLYVSATTC